MVKHFSVESLSSETLTKFVRLAIGNDAANVSDWRCQSILGGGGAATGGLYRFEGRAHDRGQEICWSLVIKIIRRPTDSGKSAEWNDWRREGFAYSSGVLAGLPSNVAAPRCYGVFENGQNEFWLCLEDAATEKRPQKH